MSRFRCGQRAFSSPFSCTQHILPGAALLQALCPACCCVLLLCCCPVQLSSRTASLPCASATSTFAFTGFSMTGCGFLCECQWEKDLTQWVSNPRLKYLWSAFDCMVYVALLLLLPSMLELGFCLKPHQAWKLPTAEGNINVPKHPLHGSDHWRRCRERCRATNNLQGRRLRKRLSKVLWVPCLNVYLHLFLWQSRSRMNRYQRCHIQNSWFCFSLWMRVKWEEIKTCLRVEPSQRLVFLF